MEPFSQQTRVSSLVWPWTQPPVPAEKRSVARVLVQVLIPYTVAAVLYHLQSRGVHIPKPLPYIVAGIGTILLFLGLFLPRVFHQVEAKVWLVVHFIGVALTWLLLCPLYYTYFLIGSLVIKMKGKDPMNRTLEPEAESYWIVREPKADAADRMRRQY